MILAFDEERAMTTLIKNILEKSQIESLHADFQVLKMIPEEIARQAQLLLFSSPKTRHFQALTTNNRPEEVQKLLAKMQQQGWEIELFYTSNEGFELALEWYQELSAKESAQQIKAENDQKAE